MHPTIISFVRHGEVHNSQRIYYGCLPRFRLSENGRNQAAVAAQILQNQDVTAVYSILMLRARQTAQVIGDSLGLPARRSRRLIEARTPFDGQPLAVLEARRWDGYTGSPPEYEQPTDIVARITRLIQFARRKADDYPTHAAVLSLSFNGNGERPSQIAYRRPTLESTKNNAG
ncbi:MAG: histidine phosphatase family protein [Chloroflexi bacterium]|nr:histidine phosphatase family protein [Chloroflexota bacterium]